MDMLNSNFLKFLKRLKLVIDAVGGHIEPPQFLPVEGLGRLRGESPAAHGPTDERLRDGRVATRYPGHGRAVIVDDEG